MRFKLCAILGSAALLMQACAQKPLVQTPVAEAPDEAGHAAQCSFTPNPATIDPATPLQVKVEVTNDGGWCAVRLNQVKTALLRTPPEHGRVYFRNVRDLTRLQYTPNAGFAGTDHFKFQIQPGAAIVEADVTVTAPATPVAAPAAVTTPAVTAPATPPKEAPKASTKRSTSKRKTASKPAAKTTN